MSGRVFMVACEASGDALGADLIIALRARDGALRFAGSGGPAMAAQGVASVIDIARTSVLGLIEGLMAYREVIKAVDEIVAAALAFQPDVVVLIDSWGTTLRVAQRLKERLPRVPRIKYVGPQVWATRPGRAKTLAAAVDHLICIHEFETPYYAPYNLPCTVSGHPALGRVTRGDGAAFRARHGIAPEKPILLLLPGSRRSEIRRTGPVLEKAAQKLCATHRDLLVVTVAAASVAAAVRARAQSWPFPHLLIEDEAEKADAFAAGAVALATSGTVTTELALQGVPVIVGYKAGWITWARARAFLMRSRFITLLNVAAGREVAPEFLQTRLTAGRLVAAGARLLDDPAARAAQIKAQDGALDAMGRGGKPAAEIAADTVLAIMRRSQAAP
jgi:lipid-A-disaccharide synthase